MAGIRPFAVWRYRQSPVISFQIGISCLTANRFGFKAMWSAHTVDLEEPWFLLLVLAEFEFVDVVGEAEFFQRDGYFVAN